MKGPHVVIIGGGIAGASLAYYLGSSVNVTLVEAETTLAYHATGRSAALLFETYGAEAIRPLTKASKPFLEDPPSELTDYPLLTARGALTIASEDRLDDLDDKFQRRGAMGVRQEWLTPSQALELCPVLESEYVVGAIWEPDARDIDVASLHQAFIRGMRAGGGEVLTGAPVSKLRHIAGSWVVTTGEMELSADIVVNAAGAWGDEVAAMAGALPLGVRPLRRTVFMTPGPGSSHDWPLVFDADETWYFKPDGTQLLCSPGDQTLVEPSDARPDELAIAEAIERINQATTLGIRTVRSSWAGLRTFVPDGGMAIGFDPDLPDFFWLVGQGGTGIQTSPGAAELSAALILDGGLPDSLRELDLSTLSPARFHAAKGILGV